MGRQNWDPENDESPDEPEDGSQERIKAQFHDRRDLKRVYRRGLHPNEI